ncbi:unnamed protein product [Pylaiella littoralis]
MRGYGMLTRGQRWRRVPVHWGKRAGCTSSTTTAAASEGEGIKSNSSPPHPADPLLGVDEDSTRQLGTSIPSKYSDYGDATATVERPSTRKNEDGPGGNRVRFNHQVRVILVPCVRELQDLSAQLWWGEDDYLNFRREYILAVRSEAEDAHKRHWRPYPRGATATATPAPREPKVIAEPATSFAAQTNGDTSPPSPLSSTRIAGAAAKATAAAKSTAAAITTARAANSLTNHVSDISPAAAVVAETVAVSKSSSGGEKQVDGEGGDDGGGVIILSSSISPQALASAAESAASPSPLLPSSTSCVSKEALFKRKEGIRPEDEKALLGPSSRRPPFSGHGWRSVAPAPCGVDGSKFAAAAAAADEGTDGDENDDGYRTHAMSSVSDSTEDGVGWW